MGFYVGSGVAREEGIDEQALAAGLDPQRSVPVPGDVCFHSGLPMGVALSICGRGGAVNLELGLAPTCVTILHMAAELSGEQKEELAELLRPVPLFAELHQGERLALVDISQIGTYQAGAELFRHSDVDNTLYVLRTGQGSLFHVDPAGGESL